MKPALAAMDPPVRRHPLPQREGRPKALNALGTFAHYPALTQAFHTFNGHIQFATTLSLRQRELIVLRVAELRRCEYEWAQHVVQGRDAGLSDEEIARVADGPTAPGWDQTEGAILQAVDDLIAEGSISDGTWAILSQDLDRHQVMDLVFTVGSYETVAMAFRSFAVEIDADLLPFVRPGRQ